MTKPWEKYQKTAPTAAKPWEKYKNPEPSKSGFESAVSGLANGLTFGYSDEIAAGLRAGVTAPFKDESFGQLYDEALDEQREHKDKAQKDNPWTYGGANVAGNIASPVTKVLAPAAGASTAAVMARAAAGGALMGAGESNARLTDSPEKAADFAADVAGGAALGGLTAGAFQAAGSGIKALRPENLRAAAGERAVKAATGQNLRAIKTMRATGAADGSGDALESAGRHLLSADEAGKAVVGPVSRAESILPAAQAKQKFFGNEIGRVATSIDEAMPGAVDGKKISQRILDYAAKMPETEQTKPIINRLMNEAANYEKRGVMSFAEAQKLKGAYKFKPQDSSTHAFGQEASNNLNSILRDEMNQTAKMMAQSAPKGSDLADLAGRYGDLKGKYQTYKNVAEAAQKRVDANLSNRFASPTDYGSAGLGVMAAMAQGAGPGKAALYAAAAGLANKVVRERGSAAAATGMNKLAGLLERSPEVLGKFGNALETAANRGEGALIVTHQMLMKDPEYRQLMEQKP